MMTKKSHKKKKRVPKGPSGEPFDRIEDEYKKCPHSFIFNRGRVGNHILELIADLRKVMEPFSATKLKVRKKNVLRDFIHAAGALNVTHLAMFSKTEKSVNLRIARIPRGPTLSFKIHEYLHCRTILSSLKRYHMEQKQFLHAPLLIMNGFFSEERHINLMSSMFQNMFPPINVNQVKLANVRRCLLISYDEETKLIDIRHYNIRTNPSDVSRPIKMLMKGRIPDLSRFNDISDFFTQAGSGNLSESEAEDELAPEVTLPQTMSTRGNIKSHRSKIRLTEIGPRISMKLYKIEEGLCSGQILHHELVKKSAQERLATERTRRSKEDLRAKRRKQQEINVERKRRLKEMEKMKQRKRLQEKGEQRVIKERTDNEAMFEDDDDDFEYYRKEVGKDPESFLIRRKKNKINIKNKLIKGNRKFSYNSIKSTQAKKKHQPNQKKISSIGNDSAGIEEKFHGDEKVVEFIDDVEMKKKNKEPHYRSVEASKKRKMEKKKLASRKRRKLMENS